MNLEPTYEPPSPKETASRLERVQEKMAEQKLDWYVSFQSDNVYYLTNFANFVHERPFVLLIPARGQLKFLAPKLEIPHIKSRAIGELDLITYFEFPAPEGKNWFDRMKTVLGGAARVGVESVCQLQILDAIQAERVRTDIIDDLRMIKSPYEIGRMAYSGIVVSAAMRDLLASAQVGRSFSQVMSQASGSMLSKITKDNPSINPWATRTSAAFQPARYSDDPHNFSDLAVKMESGGNVLIVNAVLNGYGSEIERTFFLEQVPEKSRKPYDVMMKARELAFALATPGTPMGDVDKAVNDLFGANGYSDNLLHRTGHGMGVTGHEGPFLAEGETRILQPGMSVTIEPGLYLSGLGGFRHSDTILITDDGNVALTEAPDSLQDLTLVDR